jgi:PAS domain S-box-containing protein
MKRRVLLTTFFAVALILLALGLFLPAELMRWGYFVIALLVAGFGLWHFLQNLWLPAQEALERLTATHAEYKILFDVAPDAFFLYELGKPFADVNQVALCRYGYSRQELLGMTLESLTAPEARAAVAQIEKTVRQTGGVSTQSVHLVKDGAPIPVWIHARLIKVDGKDHILVSARDMTEFEKNRQTLEKTQKLYQMIVSSAEEGIWMIDANAYTTFVNPKLCQMFGYSADEMLGRHLFSFMDEKAQVEARYFLERRAQGVVEEHDFRFLRKDGSEWWAMLSTNPLLDDDGNYTGSLAMVADVSERVKSEKRIHQQLDMINKLYEGSLRLTRSLSLPELSEQTAVACVDVFGARLAWLGRVQPDGSVSLLNHYPLSINYPNEIIVRYDDTPEAQGPGGQAIRSGKPVVFQDFSDPNFMPWYEKVRPYGFVCSGAFPMVSHGRALGVLNIYSDEPDFFSVERAELFQMYANQIAVVFENAVLYEQMQKYAAELERDYNQRAIELQERIQEAEGLNQRLQQTKSELESFSYSVSHDLKAPLRGIDGYSRLLLDNYETQLDGEALLFLHNIRNGVTHMAQLIDDLLSYSRLERHQIMPGSVNLNNLVKALLDERQQEVENANMTVKLDLDENVPIVYADPDGMALILRNLVDNSLKFTQGLAQPRLEISSKSVDDKCLIAVRDNGIGFDMQFHDRIFEMFQRLHTTDTYPGTGIGLAMVRRAVQRMNGRIWAESAPGQGATFFVEIACSAPKEEAQ